ncbi:aminoglycoside phosphotransferase family protein [Aeromicrobium wangtongii]|uniref:Aminoglycoside phosphotransferase family protein n=1 Tax=Aeromicrobium wangtongii TaxID=2969247 RepID=A0ABY5M8J8_9ACTN|nr:aminoglycoside phosphotransferase family protein [Aeromicrobium wangtongii]MCD9198992.1 aminoglycoside phosphotransferase family protein [Aeromicrobium wangtongii]UUP12973.1 aminoglycoside phosphotransferase family protein [Aeromicrobium wangtongii]
MALLPFDLPQALQAYAGRGDDWARWIAGLPRLVRDLLDDWELAVDGEPVHGHTALVVPVTAAGERLVLKVVMPHEEARHEALALQHWHGRGAVRLVRADPRRDALLLERLHGRDLGEVPVLEACSVVAGLLGRLHVPAPPQLVPLTAYVSRWTEELAVLPRDASLPRRVVEQAVHLGRALVSDDDSTGRLVHGDLHYGNVLAGDRAPWLAIDPKPVSGDPHYEVAPLLWNRWAEAVASGDLRTAIRRRFHTVVDDAGLDEDRARDWVVVREAHRAMWAIQDGEPDGVTAAITIIKAVQE